MIRRVFNLLAGASLGLCVVLMLIWATDRTGRKTWHFTYDTGPALAATQNNFDFTLTAGGFISYSSNHFNRWDYFGLEMSYWVAILLSAILPGVWFRRMLRPKVLPAGLCRVCGYDLRASADRCPECGTAMSGKRSM